jgi:predicted metalloprotease
LLWCIGFALSAEPSSATANPYFTGTGGKGISLAILVPQAQDLPADQNYLPTMAQGVFVQDFTKYSALSVLDRQNLQKLFEETLSGYYEDENPNVIQLGHLIHTDYIMTGSITKTSSGYALQMQIGSAKDAVTKASYSGVCSIAEFDNFTGIRKASAELLAQMGITLTDKAKQELSAASSQQAVSAQTALAQGITAQKNGTVVEALSCYIQSASYDPESAEAASRLNILTADVTSGNIGANVRNDIQWRRQWVDRLTEAESYYVNYVKTNPYYLVYSTDVKQGAINYQNETVALSFTMSAVPDVAWFETINQVIRTLKQGLAATGKAETWGLNWPANSVSTPSPFTEVKKDYAVVVEIINADGKSIGKQTVSMTYGLNAGRSKMSTYVAMPVLTVLKEVSFPSVDANLLTDNLKIQITSIDGMGVEQAAKQNKISILTEQQYTQTSNVQQYGVILKGFSQKDVEKFTIDNKGTLTKNSRAGTITGDIVIPYGIGVTSIGYWAFANNQLTSVVIPYGVTSIEEAAFQANRLTSVIIPPGVTSIEEQAFCENQLTSVTIPSSVTTIGRLAFQKNQLTSVVIPSGVTSIGVQAFYKNQLTSVTIPSSVTTIGRLAFQENQLTSVVIPSGVTSIEEAAFQENQLTSIVIPSSVTNIGARAFRDNQLTSVDIPSGVTSIEEAAFRKNQLTSVVIPSSVTTIGRLAFQSNQLTKVTISPGVTSIEEAAFEENQLTNVVIPSSVTAIGRQAFHINRLTSVTISPGVTSIGDGAFRDNQLTSVTLPSSVTSIGEYAFYKNQLTSVTIPSSVTTIGRLAFQANQLTSITLPANAPWELISSISPDSNFGGVYTSGGRRAGTYVLNKGQWQRK